MPGNSFVFTPGGTYTIDVIFISSAPPGFPYWAIHDDNTSGLVASSVTPNGFSVSIPEPFTGNTSRPATFPTLTVSFTLPLAYVPPVGHSFAFGVDLFNSAFSPGDAYQSSFDWNGTPPPSPPNPPGNPGGGGGGSGGGPGGPGSGGGPGGPGNGGDGGGSGCFNNVYWDASTGATSYTVLRRVSGAGSFSPIATGITDLSFRDDTTNAQDGVAYDYEVEAVNADGTSAPSSVVTITTHCPIISVSTPPAVWTPGGFACDGWRGRPADCSTLWTPKRGC